MVEHGVEGKTQMGRLLGRLGDASGSSELPDAVKGLEEFLCFELCGDEAAALRFESFLCFDAEGFRRPEVREALLARMLGDSLRDGERLQVRLLADFAQLREEGELRAAKSCKRRKGESFIRVVAGELADDLLSLHHERLRQASACFDLSEPGAALACLGDYACFLDCAVLPHAQRMAELSCSGAWTSLPEKVNPLKDACWRALPRRWRGRRQHGRA